MMDSSVSHLGLAQVSLIRETKKVLAHPVFAKVKPEQYEDVKSLYTHLLINGNSFQRSVLAKQVDASAVFALPELKEIAVKFGFDATLSIIMDYLKDICAYHNSEFEGRIEEFAFQVYEEYGGLTLLDLAKFADACKSGKYITKFQTVSTRGVTAEFMLAWIKEYLEERGSVQDSLLNQVKDKAPKLEDVQQVIEKAKEDVIDARQRKAKMERLESEAEKLRARLKPVVLDEEGRPLFKESGYVDLVEFLEIFICGIVHAFDMQEEKREIAKQYANQITELFRQEWDASMAKDIQKFEHYAKAQTKAMLGAMQRNLINQNPFDVINSTVQRIVVQEDIQDGAELFKRIYYITNPTLKNTSDFLSLAAKIASRESKEIKNRYPGYLEVCVHHGLLALTKKEYLAVETFRWVYEKTGSYPLLESIKSIGCKL